MYIPVIFNAIVQKEKVLNSLIIHHMVMATCISYEIISTISLPKLVNIDPLETGVIHVTDSIRDSNTDYSGSEWININTFTY